MSAIPCLTQYERQQAVNDRINELREDFMHVLESLGEMNNTLGTSWMRALKEKDWFRFGELTDQAIYEYAESCGDLREAELEAQGRLERSGRE
jgi:hypothetical protein